MEQLSFSRRAEIIGSCDVFRTLSARDSEALARRSRVVRLAKGQTFLRSGHPIERVGLIVEGRLRASLSGRDGNELLVATGEAGDVFGLRELLQGDAPYTDLVADRRSVVLEIPAKEVAELLARDAEVSLAVARDVTRWVGGLLLNLENIGLHKARTRLWNRLGHLAERYGARDPGSSALRIQHGFTQQDLADSIALTRTVVNRQLVRWREQGLIETGRGFVVVLDEDALRASVWSMQTD